MGRRRVERFGGRRKACDGEWVGERKGGIRMEELGEHSDGVFWSGHLCKSDVLASCVAVSLYLKLI